MVLPRTGEMDIQAGITSEGRDDDELPEQMIAVARFKGIDFTNQASDVFWNK